MDMHTDRLLVSTKFSPPRIGTQSIHRQRLLVALAGMVKHRVGLVTGSPGFGKTTLLAQWRQEVMRTGADVAWLSLSVDDKQLSIFFAYLRGALQRLGIAVDFGIPPQGVRPEFIDEVVAAVVEGASGINKELFLVLDDYQHVTDQRAHQLIQRLLDHSPVNLHFVIASRVAPPLNLSRLRLQDEIVDIDCAALPFDLGETRAFIELNLASLKLTVEEIYLIHELTSGWPASLQLILFLLRSNPDARTTLRDLGWRSDDLQTYLAEEVMSHLPADLAKFMEQISICRRFNASLAEAVTGNSDAAAMLKRLDSDNLLIVRAESDDRQLWYRFHALFGDFLLSRFTRHHQRDQVEMHRRAAHWLADQSLLAEAVRHATLGEDLDFAAEVIERAAPVSWSLDQLSPLLRLMERLPQEILFSRPRLFFLGCLACALTARPAKAESWLEQFRRSGAAQQIDAHHRLPLIQAAIEVQYDRSDSIIELLEGFVPLAEDYSVTRYGSPALLAIAYSAAGRYADALQCLDQNLIPQADSDSEMALVGEGARTLCNLQAGRMYEAEQVGRVQLARAVAIHGHRSASAYLGAATLAEVYRERDLTDDAREVLANRKGLLQWAMPDTMLRATICRARLDLLQESPTVAMTFLEQQVRHFRHLGLDRPLVHCLAEQSRLALLQLDRATAAERMAQIDQVAVAYGQSSGFLAEIPAIAALARVRICLADNYPARALEALKAVGSYAQRYQRGQLKVLALLLEVQAREDLRESEQVNTLLGEALQLGSELGLIRTFLDEGPLLQRLLLSFAEHSPSEYLTDLLSRFGGGDPASRGGKTSGVTAQTLLTPRELAILQLIHQAMSNKRVALTLNISLETVKWNLKNVYVKLGVSSRYDAISWARKHEVI